LSPIEFVQRENTMEKILIKVSYWLGVVCIVLALLSKALNAIGVDFAEFTTRGNEVGYHSFVIGAVLFFLMAIATESFDSFHKRNP
jgi:succinate dehydrogenase/fumarate reductase cytochrome b subunit